MFFFGRLKLASQLVDALEWHPGKKALSTRETEKLKLRRGRGKSNLCDIVALLQGFAHRLQVGLMQIEGGVCRLEA